MMIVIPESYSYIEAYLTFRCNLNCGYCINKYSGAAPIKKELDSVEWVNILNNIKTNGLPITLGGGEPTIHNGFYDIINNTGDEIIFDLLTNGRFDVDEFIKNAPVEKFSRRSDEYKSIRISYHAQSNNAEIVAETAKMLIDAGYMAGVFGINHPHNLSKNVVMTEICSKIGVYFFIRDFLGFHNDRLYGNYKYYGALNGNRKKCLCKTSELLINPSGEYYRCHRDLYSGNEKIGDLSKIELDNDTIIENKFRLCDNYGFCNPCDSKEKISIDLKTSRCSVEIIDID